MSHWPQEKTPTVSAASDTTVFDVFDTSMEIAPETLAKEIAGYESSLSAISPRVAQNVVVESLATGVVPVATSVLTSAPGKTCAPEDAEVSEIPSLAPPPSLAAGAVADIWQVDTSAASLVNPDASQTARIVVHRWRGSDWERTSLEDFYGSQAPGQPVLFFIHGNRVTPDTALMEALSVLRRVPALPQVRLVVYHWNADRVSRRPRPEFATKAVYADYQGFYLSYMLQNMQVESPVGLVGHSFGCRTVLSSLHLLGGGMYAGRPLDSATGKAPSQIRAFLVAAATDRTDLIPGGRFQRALDPAQLIAMTQNRGDTALKLYPEIGLTGRLPEAMGLVGPATQGLDSESIRKLLMVNVQLPSHAVRRYLEEPMVQQTLSLRLF
ncbi:MAG: hypothetical protein Q4D98_12080 [Planctomycetia bacterium]|nr:hypothetical protein [Planctomycetia bacterium]